MSRRFQSRRGNGRFTRNTMENTFGLHVPVCPDPACRRFNPHSVGTPAPEKCHACGAPMLPTTASPNSGGIVDPRDVMP